MQVELATKEYVDSRIVYIPINIMQPLDGSVIENEWLTKAKRVDAIIRHDSNVTKTFVFDTKSPTFDSYTGGGNTASVTYSNGKLLLGNAEGWYLTGITCYM